MHFKKISFRKSFIHAAIDLATAGAKFPILAKMWHRVMLRSRQLGKNDPFDAEEYRFLAKVLLDRHRSRSQIFQDLWVLHELGAKRNGYFVEFGAADGVYLSNTWLLEKEYGWKGILAEPAPPWHDALHRNRSAIISTECVSSTTGHRVLLRIPKNLAEYATTSNDFLDSVHSDKFINFHEVQVCTISLVDLLKKYDAPKEIDYISMDVEGAEVEILESFDFDSYNIHLWSIEANNRQAYRVDRIMQDHGYERCFKQFSLFDAWYRLKR